MIHNFECGACDFNDLGKGYWRCAALPDRFDKGRNTSAVSLVLPPQPHSAKAGPAEAEQGAEVVELEDATSAKDIKSFFREGPMTIGKIMLNILLPLSRNAT